MAGTLKLYQNIANYMKFMAFVRSASPLTLRAYWVDLRQIFQIGDADLRPGWGPQKGAGFNAEGEPFAVPGPSYRETELLDRLRVALQQWASLSLASRNRKIATLKSFLSWAYDEKLTAKDLSERVTCPKVPRKLPHYLSVDEVTSLMKSLERDASPQGAHARVLTLLLYGGGLRVSEACNLKWKDVDLDRRLARVTGKGSKERLVPFPERTAEAMRALGRRGDYVFGIGPLATRKAYDWIRAAGEKAGLHHRLHPHALRHSFATHLLGGGANLRTLQELLGHESLRATERYTHLGIDQLARTMEAHHPLGAKAPRKRRAG